MKKIRFMSFVLAAVMLLSIPSFGADTRASEQIHMHLVYAVAEPGQIYVEASIYGNGIMDKIGCQSIDIFEDDNGWWSLCYTLSENDEGMSSEDTSMPTRSNPKSVSTIMCSSQYLPRMKTAGTHGRMSTTSPVFEKGCELMEEARFMERTNHLAENLLEIQREKGMKLAEFSRELGLPRSTLQYVMCNGNTALATLVHIANSLGSSLDELVFGGMPPMKVREKQVLVDIDNCS